MHDILSLLGGHLERIMSFPKSCISLFREDSIECLVIFDCSNSAKIENLSVKSINYMLIPAMQIEYK